MSLYHSYQFRVIPVSSLPAGDSKDPFRFDSDANFQALPEKPFASEFKLEVQDLDANRQVNEHDRFVYTDETGSKYLLNSSEGLKLLNYYVDPEVLKSRDWGMVVTRSLSEQILPRRVPENLEKLSSFGEEEIQNIREFHFPYWEVDGHLDLDILAGLRIYTEEENDRWTGFRGVPIYFDWKYFRNRVLLEKGAVAVSFISMEHLTTAPFVWQMYTTNFLSMVGGSVTGNSREEGIIHAGQLYADGSSTTNNTRRSINLQTAQSRSSLAKDHLYFSLTWPLVLGACFADPHFRNFWPAPWRLPRFGVLYHYFSGQFTRAIPFMGRSALGVGMAALSGYGIYEMSSVWFDVYGHMPQGSTENRAFSTISTVLTQAALYSRASREFEILTGSSRLSFEGLQQLKRMELSMRMSLEVPRVNLFGLKFPFPKPAPYLEWTETLSRSNLLKRYGVAEVGTAELAGAAETNLLARRALLQRLSAGEVLTTERAVLTLMSRLAVPAAEENLLLAEKIVLRSRVKSVGLPLLGGAVLLGAGLGFCYLTGIFNKDRNPRTWVREYFGM